MIITKTPFRLSFFGGGTDHNAWLEDNNGFVVSTTFSKYCYITLRKLPQFFDHNSRVVYSQVELVKNNCDIQHPAVRNCLKFMDITEGVEIHHDGDLPARSGLGSSSAFTIGLLKALYALQTKMVSKKRLADEAIHVEQILLEENVGIQDQIITSYGGFNTIEMNSRNDYTVSPLILPDDYLKNIEEHVLLGFTGISRISSHNAGAQISKIRSGEIKDKMHDIYHIAKEGGGLFSQNVDISKIGNLLDKSWQLKRSLTPSMSTSGIDNTYQRALKVGAYGGKLLGAGGGGFIMFLAPPEKHQEIKDELKNDVPVWVPFKLDSHGSQVMHFSDVSV